MKRSKVVSKFLNSLKLLNKDQHISRRYVLQVLTDISKTLISHKLLDRTLSNEFNLYTNLNCVELKKDDVVRCPIVEFRRCKVLMKSVKPLPEPIFSRIGSSITNIESVDGSLEIDEIDIKQYRRNALRKVKIDDNVYAYLGYDMHLYIPDKEVYSVNLSIITMNTESEDLCSECSDNGCKSGWDYEFICPDKLLTTVFDKAREELAGVYKQITPDQNPNHIEGN